MEERRRDGWSVTIVPLERKPAADQDADAPGQTGGGR